MNKFSPEVIEKLGYYVYRLIDPRNGNTFYVGKGKGNRVFAHVKDALSNYDGEDYTEENEEDSIDEKIKTIRDIRSSGLEVIHLICRYGLTEKEAFEVESALIDTYLILTNIQNGHYSDRGVNSAEVLERELSLEEYEEVEGINYIIIKIKNETIQDQGTIYEAVRKHWKINKEKALDYPYVFAVINGVVREVYEVENWFNSKEIEGRVYFEGEVADSEIRNHFINKRIPDTYSKKGNANPIQYKR